MESNSNFASGLPAAKQQRAQATIDQVLAETCRVLSEQGESKVRVQEISSATDVSIGSIYHHFGNREGLIVAAHVENFTIGFRRHLEMLITWLDSIEELSQLTENTDSIRNLVNAHFSDHATMERIAILGSTIGRPKLKATLISVQSELISNFEVSIKRLQDKGFIKANLTPRTIAIMTLGIILGHAVSELDDRPLDNREWNQVLLEMLSGLIPLELLAAA